jgi:hypothetical protein
MDWKRSGMLALIGIGIAAVMTLSATEVLAQSCETPVCRSGYRLTRLPDRDRPVCLTGSGLEPQSFYYAPEPICPADADLRGQNCVKRICCIKPACAAGRRYEDGKCIRTGFGGVMSYVRAMCETGWDLDRPTGTCKNRACGATITLQDLPIAVQAPAQVRPGPFIGGFQPEGCVRKGSALSILGREFGTQAGKAVAVGGRGVHVDLPVTSWSAARIEARLPNDPAIRDGESYYVGIERAGHAGWLSNIDKRVTICR